MVITTGERIVSYTQFSMYLNCPKSWQLGYGMKLRKQEPSISLVFGTAMHNTIQEWISDYYSSGVKPYPMESRLNNHMLAEFGQSVEKWNQTFSSPDELFAYYNEGLSILRYLDAHIMNHVPIDTLEFVGYEVPIEYVPVKSRPTVKLKAYLDLVFKRIGTDQHIIYDIKTSTRGWSDHQMTDRTKIAQMALYIYYLSIVLGIDMRNISAEYLILKRQSLSDELVQEFVPLQTPEFIARMVAEFEDFIITCFDESGNYILDRDYVADSGRGGFNCKFCEFSEIENLCPTHMRI